jgi:hypothetical protein
LEEELIMTITNEELNEEVPTTLSFSNGASEAKATKSKELTQDRRSPEFEFDDLPRMERLKRSPSATPARAEELIETEIFEVEDGRDEMARYRVQLDSKEGDTRMQLHSNSSIIAPALALASTPVCTSSSELRERSSNKESSTLRPTSDPTRGVGEEEEKKEKDSRQTNLPGSTVTSTDFKEGKFAGDRGSIPRQGHS